MAKIIPTEQLILLYNKMLSFSPRHPERKHLICAIAEGFGVSESTICDVSRNIETNPSIHLTIFKPLV